MVNSYDSINGKQEDVLRTTITGRDPEPLAAAYGFETLADLMNDIPEGANVIDLGSGLSCFGRTIAANRPDIEWVDLDARYEDPSVLDEIMRDAPDNLAFAGLNILDIDKIHDIESYDRVFSYFLLPYLRRYDSREGFQKSCQDILGIVKRGGKLALGPIKRNSIGAYEQPVVTKDLPVGRAVWLPYDSSITVCPAETNMSDEEIAAELEEVLW